MKCRRFIASLLLFAPTICLAAGRTIYEDWVVDETDQSVEAYTLSGTDTSFGLFCSGAQCVFYIHQPINCVVGSQSAALMNTGTRPVALTTGCARIGQQLFQILDQFNETLGALQAAQFLVIATPTKDGSFAISRFGMRGGLLAIKHAVEATARMSRPNAESPKLPIVPGVRRADELHL